MTLIKLIYMVKYKYLIINGKSDNIIIKYNLREIEEYIRDIYPHDTISHNTISKRFYGNKYMEYYDLIVIKEMIWKILDH